VRDLAGKTAVVTGAGSGLGLAIAEAFLAEGMRVVVADVDAARVDAEAARLRGSGGETLGVVTDVGDPAAVDDLARQATDEFGAVDVVVNNAGIVRAGPAWELSLEDWEQVLRVNLWGVIHGVRTFVPRMLASGTEGHIVNVASMAAVVPVPQIAPYNVSKHGVLALSETLRRELDAAGAPIGVSVVMPGFVPTRLGSGPGSESVAANAPTPVQPGGVTAGDVARHVVDAVRENRLFVFTHPDRVADARRRFDEILSPRKQTLLGEP
jgi:NAD(P)-dependent dehydrogenase (short-subunit alcohol dehydrogenase family)